MKKFKKLRLAFVGALLLSAAGPLRPAMAWFSSTYLETSQMVDTSSMTTSPSTLLLPANSGSATVQVWCFQKANLGETVMIQSSNSNWQIDSATGTLRIQCSSTTAHFQPLVLNDYTGPLYAVNRTSYTVPVNVLRMK